MTACVMISRTFWCYCIIDCNCSYMYETIYKVYVKMVVIKLPLMMAVMECTITLNIWRVTPHSRARSIIYVNQPQNSISQ